MSRTVTTALFALLTLACQPSAAGSWELDAEQSALSFVSLKNVDVAEAHHFNQLSGSLDDDGQFELVIDLDSVDTAVPIRDERMREHVFAGESRAVVRGAVDVTLLTDLGVGRSTSAEVRGELSFRGSTTPLVARVRISAIDGRQLQVVSTDPILVSARTLGVADGVEKLRELAALKSISMAVPVYLSLTWRQRP